MPTDDEAARSTPQERSQVHPSSRLGIDVLLTSQVAREIGVNARTVERWITKPENALPALRVSAAQLYAMGYRGNLPQNTDTFYLVRSCDMPLIPAIRKYPQGRKRPNRKRVRSVTQTP